MAWLTGYLANLRSNTGRAVIIEAEQNRTLKKDPDEHISERVSGLVRQPALGPFVSLSGYCTRHLRRLVITTLPKNVPLERNMKVGNSRELVGQALSLTTWHHATGSDCSRKSTAAPKPSAHAMTSTRTLPQSFQSRNSILCLQLVKSLQNCPNMRRLLCWPRLFDFFSTARMAPIHSIHCVFGLDEGQGSSSCWQGSTSGAWR